LKPLNEINSQGPTLYWAKNERKKEKGRPEGEEKGVWLGSRKMSIGETINSNRKHNNTPNRASSLAYLFSRPPSHGLTKLRNANDPHTLNEANIRFNKKTLSHSLWG
jgi:hypothetical protein